MGSFSHCIRHINRCARAYREERLGPLGLHGGQAMFITHVCRHPGVSQEGLGRHVLLSKSNVTRRLMALEQDGFVRRCTRRCSHPGRQTALGMLCRLAACCVPPCRLPPLGITAAIFQKSRRRVKFCLDIYAIA